jgi:hypothetical protein
MRKIQWSGPANQIAASESRPHGISLDTIPEQRVATSSADNRIRQPMSSLQPPAERGDRRLFPERSLYLNRPVQNGQRVGVFPVGGFFGRPGRAASKSRPLAANRGASGPRGQFHPPRLIHPRAARPIEAGSNRCESNCLAAVTSPAAAGRSQLRAIPLGNRRSRKP